MRIDNDIPKKEESKKPGKVVQTSVASNVTVHDAHILDSSGSMSGGKYTEALRGIQNDIEASKQQRREFPDIKSTMTVVEFSNRIVDHMFMTPIENVGNFSSRCMNDMTALHDAIGHTIEKIMKAKQPQDKVLLKIFTDGGENASRKYSTSSIKELIKKAEANGFTVTFVGTDADTRQVIKNLAIDQSNTLVHNNTSKGVEMAFSATVQARTSYMKSVSKGEDVTRGFYGKSIKK